MKSKINGEDWTCPKCGGQVLKCEVTHHSDNNEWTCWVVAQEVDMSDDGNFSVPQYGEYLTGDEPNDNEVWTEEDNLCCANCSKPVCE